MDIKGGTNLISIAQLSFTMTSTDPGNTLDWTYSPIPYSYSGLNTGSADPVYLGIIYGPNGQNTYVTNGPATQLVNEIVTCGSGNAWWPDGTSSRQYRHPAKQHRRLRFADRHPAVFLHRDLHH